MEYGQLHWDIMGDINAFIEVAKTDDSAPFTDFCSHHIVKNFNGIVESEAHNQLHRNEIVKIIQELSVEKKPDENKPASRRPTLGGDNDQAPQLEGKNLRQAKALLTKLMKEPEAWPFLEPVNPTKLGIPDYFDIIKHPMDLGTVKNNMDRNKYTSLTEWVADVRLVFQNALTYNPKGSAVALWAEQLREKFEQRVAATTFEKTGPASKAPKQPKAATSKSPNIGGVGAKKRKADMPPLETHSTGNSAVVPNGQHGSKRPHSTPPAPAVPTQPIKQENSLTFEEKKRIGEAMNKLDSDQLIKAIEIISESNKLSEKGGIDNEDDETIDIDMSEVDDATLRKLERFIDKCLSIKKEDEEDQIL